MIHFVLLKCFFSCLLGTRFRAGAGEMDAKVIEIRMVLLSKGGLGGGELTKKWHIQGQKRSHKKTIGGAQ